MGEAHKLIAGASSFGPETLKVIGQAFDEAWASIADSFGDEPVRVETARLKLANIILSISTEGSRDVDALKVKALEAMARNEGLP